MVACWQEDPLKRPSFKDIVEISTRVLDKMGGPPSARDGSRSLVREIVSSLMVVDQDPLSINAFSVYIFFFFFFTLHLLFFFFRLFCFFYFQFF